MRAVLVPVPRRQARSSRSRSSGATLQQSAGRCRRGAALLRVGPASSRLDPRQRRHGVHLGRRPPAQRMARESASDNQYSRVRDVAGSTTLLIGGTLDFATPPRNATRELLPYLPNGHQVVLPELGHTTTSGTTSRRRARSWSTRSSTAARSTTRSTPRRRSTSRPSVTQTALGKGIAGDDGRPRAARAAVAAADVARACAGAAATGARRAPCSGRCYPLVLGLGGWFIGLLIVLLVFPTVAARRRARRVPLDRAADRPRRLPRLGPPRAAGRAQADRLRRRRRRARSSAPGSGSTRRPGCSRSSRRSPVPSSART